MLYLLPQCVDRAAERTPDQEAVRFGGQSLSYATLAEQSRRLARLLVREGVQRGDRVGMYLDKSLLTPVAMYGIMQAGAAYVPLDPAAPIARLSYIIRDCGIHHLVTEPTKSPSVHQLCKVDDELTCLIGLPPQEGLPVRTISWSEVEREPSDPLSSGTIEQDLAYVLYTSGSTGEPKGVMHTHRSALSWAEVSAHTFGLRPADRVSNHAPVHFDLSTLDFFATAVAGATTVIIPDLYTKFPASLATLIEQERLTILYVVPFALVQLLLHGAIEQRDHSALRWVLFGGEPIPPKHLKRLMALWPHARFSNIYGPTETNGVTYYFVPPLGEHDDQPIPIGRPFENVDALVVDASDRPVDVGQSGELLIRSPTMMRGYWGRPDLSDRALSRRPVQDGFMDVYHRTGDLVRQQSDGLFHFLGRMDRQIKTRGYRVELDEVEAALAAYPDVDAAAVYAVSEHDGSQRIEAAVTLKRISARPNARALEPVNPALLRTHLTSHLPSYALPEKIIVLDELPQTSTGKIDRRRLQAGASALNTHDTKARYEGETETLYQ